MPANLDEQALFSGTQEVAPDRRFDIAKLQAFMEEHVEGFTGTVEAPCLCHYLRHPPVDQGQIDLHLRSR